MERINITGTDDTPGIILDKSTGEFQITGRSLPEDVAAFFEPILDWMEMYAEDPLPKTVFEFKQWLYFKTWKETRGGK